MSTKSVNIPLSGLSTSPSDYQVSDGHLAAAIGVVHEDGAIHNAVHTSPKIEYKMPEGTSVIYQHITDTHNIYIISTYVKDPDGNYRVYYVFDDGDKKIDVSCSDRWSFLHAFDSSIISIVSVGNTLIVNTSRNKYYFLFKYGSYEYLGNKIPSFSVKYATFTTTNLRRFVNEDTSVTYSYNSHYDSDTIEKNTKDHGNVEQRIDGPYDLFMYDDRGSDENKKKSVDAIAGNANMIVHYAAKEGRYTQPFSVRCAMRLYDGSFVNHTSPTLFFPTTNVNPIHVWSRLVRDQDTKEYRHYFVPLMIEIVLRAYIDGFDKNMLEKWSDIIKSFVFASSEQIYSYEQDAEYCEEEGSDDEDPYYTYGHQVLKKKYTVGYGGKLQTTFDFLFSDKGKATNYKYFASNGELGVPGRVVHPQHREISLKEISEIGTYYILGEKTVSDMIINNDKYIVGSDRYYESGYDLTNISSKERLPDEYYSNDTICADGMIAYNSRLSMYGIHRIPYGSADGESINLENLITISKTDSDHSYSYEFFVEIHESNKKVVLKATSTDLSADIYIHYFYYPNPKAKYLYVKRTDENGDVTRAKLPLVEHSLLNGAYYSSGLEIKEVEYNMTDEIPELTEDSRVDEKSLVYTSEAGNPFVVKAENVDKIGNGKILSLVPSAIALSEGQFGQFPMYAFTTDGIWALSVNETGGWSSVQPISRDVPLVVTDDDGVDRPCILQLDRDVVFATDRGLMLLSGSKVTCISEVFDGTKDEWFDKYAAHLANIFEKTDIEYTSDLFVPFREYLRGGNMHYDYTHQRIIVGNKQYPFCFVFSMKDRLWSAININVLSSVNSYPESLALASIDGESYSFVLPGYYETIKGEVIIGTPEQPTEERKLFKTEWSLYGEKTLYPSVNEMEENNGAKAYFGIDYDSDSDFASVGNVHIEGDAIIEKDESWSAEGDEDVYYITNPPSDGNCYTIFGPFDFTNSAVFYPGVEFIAADELRNSRDFYYKKGSVDYWIQGWPSPGTEYRKIIYPNGKEYSLKYHSIFTPQLAGETDVYFAIKTTKWVGIHADEKFQNRIYSFVAMKYKMVEIPGAPGTPDIIIPDETIWHEDVTVNCESGKKNYLIDFTKHDDNELIMPSDGYLLTRPLKLGAPDLLKVIRSINLRGVFHEESRVSPSRDFQSHTFGMILYGTNDPSMLQWNVVGSVMGSRMQFRYGSPYKAFRLAIISHMKQGESLSHAEVVYEIRETDKVR